MNILVEAVGWTGAICVLIAYALLSMKKLQSDGYIYHGMNILGAILLAMYAFWKNASASLTVNVVWMLIGLGAIINGWRRF